MMRKRTIRSDLGPIEIHESTGNVFLDIGFPPGEAETLIVRADLMVRLERLMKRRRLSPAKAAKLFGVTRPRLRNLLKGKIGRFTVDALIAMLGRAGMEVRLTVQRRAS